MKRAPVVLGVVLTLTVSGEAVAPTSATRAELTYTRVDRARHSVWVARADGSAPREIAAPGYAGALERGGRWLSYSRPQDRPDTALTPLFVVDLLTGKSRRLGEAYRGERWSPRGAELAFADEDGLFLVDVSSGKRRELVAGDDIGAFSFSPDGTAIAFARHNGRVGPKQRSDIFVVKLADRVTTRLTHDGHSTSPLWAGKYIAFNRLRWASGNSAFPISALWLMRADGTGTRLLAKGDENMSMAHYGLDGVAVSLDGQRLLACQAAEFYCAPVSVMVPAGRRYRFPEIDAVTRARELSLAEDLSADGRQVLVDVGPFDGDAGSRIYEVPFAGGKPRLLLHDAIDASWAH